MDNDYLLRRLEESSGYYQHSFSNRYMNWKRFYSISKLFQEELKKNKGQAESLRVLDTGCGDGWMIYKLKAAFSDEYKLHFTGVDISELDIDFADKRKEYFSHDDCEFKVMDVDNLSFKDGEFDIIICSEVIEHLKNPEILIRGLFRVLKKGGVVILTTPQKDGSVLAKAVRLANFVSHGLLLSCIKNYEKNIISSKERPLLRFSSEEGKTGAGEDHCSVHSAGKWKKIFKDGGFIIKSLKGTSGPWFGGPYLDAHRIVFALSILMDAIVERLPFSYLWSESLLFELRKGSSLIHKHGLYL